MEGIHAPFLRCDPRGVDFDLRLGRRIESGLISDGFKTISFPMDFMGVIRIGTDSFEISEAVPGSTGIGPDADGFIVNGRCIEFDLAVRVGGLARGCATGGCSGDASTFKDCFAA